MAGAQHGPLVRLAYDDVGRRQVQQDPRARQRRPRRGRQRGPIVLADLDREDEARPIDRFEEQTRREVHRLAVQPEHVFRARRRRREPALLVVFAVVGQIGLGHNPQHLAGPDHHRTVIQGVAVADRRPDHRHDIRLGRRLRDHGDLPLDLVQQRRLHMQIVDRIGRQRQFGKDHQVHALLARLTDQGDVLLAVRPGVAHVADRRRRRHAHEAVGLGRMEQSISHRIVRITRPAPVVGLHIGANDEGGEFRALWSSVLCAAAVRERASSKAGSPIV